MLVVYRNVEHVRLSRALRADCGARGQGRVKLCQSKLWVTARENEAGNLRWIGIQDGFRPPLLTLPDGFETECCMKNLTVALCKLSPRGKVVK